MMQAKGWTFFNVLVNRYHPKEATSFLEALPSTHTAISSSDVRAALNLPQNLLSAMHFSWFAPILKQSSESLRNLLLTCLSDTQRQGICRLLQIPLPHLKVSKSVKQYLTHHLAAQIGMARALPLAYLPETPLTPLASLPKEKFILLIDYLGLRDLAEAMRPIVDNRLLQAIHRCLTPSERQLLRIYLHQRDPLKASKLDFAKWSGQRDSLRLLYHQRGLARLAKALSGQSPDLLWHIRHRLDQKRAGMLEDLGIAKEPTVVTPTLVLQVTGILEFLERTHE